MDWISIKDQKPPQEAILVFAICGMPHVAIFDYETYCHTECCYSPPDDTEILCSVSLYHASGESIDFTHWMPLPKPPQGE